MNGAQRNLLDVTDDGLIHIAVDRDSSGKVNAQQLPASQGSDDLLIRLAMERGHTDLGWLNSFHSFTFGGYYDQHHMGFRSLRVINDDKIAAGRGFPTHPHRDMEIVSYVLQGALQHKDSTGKGAIITPDTIQMMSAGTGITHSEYNPSQSGANHFLQIWIEPAMRGLQPRYSERTVTTEQKQNRWQLIARPIGSRHGFSPAAVDLNQDAKILASKLGTGEALGYTVERERHAWLQVATGAIVVNGTLLSAGDAIASSRPTRLHVTAQEDAEVLLFDLA